MSLIYGPPFIASGQGESAFSVITFSDGGVIYSDSFLGFWQHEIPAAGIPTEPTITYPPVLHFYTVPTCCTVQEQPVESPIPEPASLGLFLIAVALMLLPKRWKVTRR
jgi:hypothetical protein